MIKMDRVVDIIDDRGILDVFEETAIMCYCLGWSNKWIINNLLIDSARLYKILDHYNIPKKGSKWGGDINRTERNQEIIDSYYNKGRDESEIASAYNISETRVRQILKENSNEKN